MCPTKVASTPESSDFMAVPSRGRREMTEMRGIVHGLYPVIKRGNSGNPVEIGGSSSENHRELNSVSSIAMFDYRRVGFRTPWGC